MAEDRKSTHERTLRGVHVSPSFHGSSVSHFLFCMILCIATTAGCPAGPCLFHVAYDDYPGIGVPVVPCGRRVVISGILAGGTPGFRNALMFFCTLPGRLACVFFLVLVLLRYLQGSIFST